MYLNANPVVADSPLLKNPPSFFDAINGQQPVVGSGVAASEVEDGWRETAPSEENLLACGLTEAELEELQIDAKSLLVNAKQQHV